MPAGYIVDAYVIRIALLEIYLKNDFCLFCTNIGGYIKAYLFTECVPTNKTIHYVVASVFYQINSFHLVITYKHLLMFTILFIQSR